MATFKRSVLSESNKTAMKNFGKNLTAVHRRQERRRGRGNITTNSRRKKAVLPTTVESDENAGRTPGETTTIPENTVSEEKGLH